jgi:ribosomal protein S15P/S13E
MEQDLCAIIKEMQMGLEQAIADARTAKEHAYTGFDGQLLSQGDRYIYQYTLRTPWDPEENSRIYVEREKGKPIAQQLAARVISRIGPALMCSTREPIPTHLLKKVTLIEDTAWLLERMREVLQRYLDGSLEEAPGAFGAKVLGLRPVQYGKKRTRGKLSSFVLNTEQQQAIEHGRGSEQTFIVGAAGTGKSTVEALLANHCLKQGDSILAVSHTNIATDNLFLDIVQCAEESGDAGLLHLLQSEHMVRAGDPHHVSLRAGAYRHLTVSAIAEARMGNLAHTRLQLEEKRQMLAQAAEELARRLPQEEARWQAERPLLAQQAAALQDVLAPLEERERARLESIERGIKQEGEQRDAARQQLARLVEEQVDLKRQLHEWQGDGRRDTELEGARQRLAALEQKRWRVGRQYKEDLEAAQREVVTKQAAWDEADRMIASLNEDIQRNRQEQIAPRGKLEKAEVEILRLQNASASTYFTDQMTPHRRKLEPLLEQIQTRDAELEARRAELKRAQDERGRIDAQLAELRAQLSALKTAIVAEARLVTTTVTGAYLNPDLLKRQFDIILLDEVSMISLVAALLVCMRATRRVIAGGDPMQFLPILKTECSKQERKHKMPEAVKWLARDLLTHLDITIFDAIAGAKGCVLLREQGRMHPKILAPINRTVYQNMLTSRPETEIAPSIAPLPENPLMLVDSSLSRESRAYKPSKRESRVNDHHVKVVVALIPQILVTLPERSAREDPTVPRIGVLAPYRSQIKRLLKAVRKADLEQYVHVGTINTAQSLQFDVIILDTVEAPGLQPFDFTCDRILDDTNMATEATRRLNVGHTRARYKLIYIAHLDHLRRHQPANPNDEANKRRLLIELVEWTGREGSISSLEVLRSTLG